MRAAWGALKDDAGRALDVHEVAAETLTGMEPQVLTDDHAPVEDLLAPVVRKRADGGIRKRR